MNPAIHSIIKQPQCHTCDSENCFIRRHVKMEWKRRLIKTKHSSTFQKRQVIFSEGDPVSGIYFIYNGKVKVYKSSMSGRTQIVRFAGPGDILGHRGFGKIKTYPIGADTLTPSVICYIPSFEFIKTIKANHTLALHLLNFYADELRNTERKLLMLSHMTVRQKISEAILVLADIYGTQKEGKYEFLEVTLSRQEYAGFTGSSVEEVIRTLSQLKKDNLIELDGKRVGITSRNGLEEIIAPFVTHNSDQLNTVQLAEPAQMSGM